MKNILVTGGLGYIGSNISNLLLKNKNYKCIILDDLSNSKKKKLTQLSNINPRKPIFIKENFGSKKISKIFEDNKIYAVVHCAANKSVPESLLNPNLYYKNNISNLINLLEIMKNFNCNNFIFSSSACVYDHSLKAPFKESSKIKPLNTYGFTKVIGEKIIKDFSYRFKSFKFIILRYFNPVGTDDTGFLGDDPKFPENIIPRIVKSINQKKRFTIYGDDYNTKDGTCYRDYIDIRDISEAHILALNKIKKIKNEIFNIGTGKAVSVKEIIKIFELNKKIKINYKVGKRRHGDFPLSLALPKKAETYLKFKAKYNINLSIKNILRHQIK